MVRKPRYFGNSSQASTGLPQYSTHWARVMSPFPTTLASRKSTSNPTSFGCKVDGGSREFEAARLQIGQLQATAPPVAVGEFVEGRHPGAGPAAFDSHRQGLAVDGQRAQVGAVRHLVVHLAAVARPAVTCLTIAFLHEDAHAFCDILRRLRAGWRKGPEQQTDDDDRNFCFHSLTPVVYEHHPIRDWRRMRQLQHEPPGWKHEG